MLRLVLKRSIGCKKAVLCGPSLFFALGKITMSSLIRNYVNLPKKLLLLTDLTIIINSLVVRINGCQNEA